MKRDPDIHDTDARDFEKWLDQAEWKEEVAKEEKWEGSTVTIGEAQDRLGITRAKFPSGEE